MRTVSLALMILTLTGCISVETKPEGTDAYRLSTSTQFGSALGASQELLDDRAGELCPSGYSLVDSRLDRSGETRTTTWRVRCK